MKLTGQRFTGRAVNAACAVTLLLLLVGSWRVVNGYAQRIAAANGHSQALYRSALVNEGAIIASRTSAEHDHRLAAFLRDPKSFSRSPSADVTQALEQCAEHHAVYIVGLQTAQSSAPPSQTPGLSEWHGTVTVRAHFSALAQFLEDVTREAVPIGVQAVNVTVAQPAKNGASPLLEASIDAVAYGFSAPMMKALHASTE